MKKLDEKRVSIIHKAVKLKGTTCNEISEVTGLPPSSVRLYCAEMAKRGMLEKLEGIFPNTYRPVAKRNWPVILQESELKEVKKVSRENVEALIKILSAEHEPDSTELVNLTYRLMRELKTQDKIKALAQFYKDIHDAIADIVDR